MPAPIRKDMYDDLDKARAKAWMIHGSCDAMDLSEMGEDHKAGWIWFEGAKHVCREIAETLSEALDVLKPEAALEAEDTDTSED